MEQEDEESEGWWDRGRQEKMGTGHHMLFNRNVRMGEVILTLFINTVSIVTIGNWTLTHGANAWIVDDWVSIISTWNVSLHLKNSLGIVSFLEQGKNWSPCQHNKIKIIITLFIIIYIALLKTKFTRCFDRQRRRAQQQNTMGGGAGCKQRH